jgi:hypothetical protein
MSNRSQDFESSKNYSESANFLKRYAKPANSIGVVTNRFTIDSVSQINFR